MAAVGHDLAAMAPDRTQRAITCSEDPAVKPCVTLSHLQRRVRGVQFKQIGTGADLQPGGHAQRLRTALQRTFKQEAAAAAGGIRGEDVASAQRQALAVLEQAQFLGGQPLYSTILARTMARQGGQSVEVK